MIEDLKQVRDALNYYKKLHSQHNEDDEIEPDEDGVIAFDALATLDRVIAEGVGIFESIHTAMLSSAPTPAPQGWSAIDTAPKDGTEILLSLWSGHPEHKTSFCWAINGYYKDGFFYSKDPMIGKLASPTHWQHITAPTPAQPEKVDLNEFASEIMDKYLVGNCEHLTFGDGVVLAIREIKATGRLKV